MLNIYESIVYESLSIIFFVKTAHKLGNMYEENSEKVSGTKS